MDRAGGRGRDALTAARPSAVAAPAGTGRPSWRLLGLHLLLLAVAAGVLAVAARGQWFFGDEWAFLGRRDVGRDTWQALLRPHNEHLSALPVAAYRSLLAAVGLHSYWPYLAVVLALHLLLAHLLWRLMLRAGAAPVTATALATLAALLGAGAENLLWAFQMGFVGSLTAGVGAVLLVDHEGGLGLRDVGAVELCLVSLACSGVGVPMVATVTLTVLLRRRGWRRAAAVTALPAVAYLAWYLAFGRDNTGAQLAPPLPPLGLGAVPRFAFDGLAHALGEATGLRGGGAVLLVGLAVLLVRRPSLLQGRSVAAVACAGGAAGFFLLAGTSRVAFGPEQARVSRYVYVGALLLLPLAALALDVVLERLRRPALAVLPLVGCLLAVNLAALFDAADETRAREQELRSVVLAAGGLAAGDAEVLGFKPDPELSTDLTVNGLRRLVERGSLPPPGRINDGDRATARARMLAHLTDAEEPAGFALDGAERARLEPAAPGCALVRPLGEQPQVAARVAARGGSLLVRPTSAGPFSLRLLTRGGQPGGALEMNLEAGVAQSLVLSTGGQVLLEVPGDAVTELCTAPPPDVGGAPGP